MKPVARIGDPIDGICYAHTTPLHVTGVIITGSSNIFSSGKGIARLGDTCLGSCGHTSTIVSASSLSTVDGRPVARKGDSIAGNIIGIVVGGDDIIETE